MKPHKHAELIHAWADGAEIQYRATENGNWKDCPDFFVWTPHAEYRIKPKRKQVRVLVGEFIEYGHFVKEGDKYEMAIVNGHYEVTMMYEDEIEDQARGMDWIVLDEYLGEIVAPMKGVR